MSFCLHVKGLDNFEEVTKKGLALKRALVGIIKRYQRDSQGSSSNDKPKFWDKNKNVVNHDVTNAKHVQTIQDTI